MNGTVHFPITIDAINSLLRPFANNALNVTFQFEIMRALEAVNRGRLELTIWTHEVWRIFEPQIVTKLLEEKDSLKIRLNSASDLKFSPETVFKNALYFKEHRTPLLNTVLQLNKYGDISLHSLYTLDIPCTKITRLKSTCIKYEVCGMHIEEDQYQNNVYAVCELYYGSITQESNQIHLNWASEDFGEPNLSCSVQSLPGCVITRIRPSKKEITFLGGQYDELVACIILSTPKSNSAIF
ncbi:unnamed protein product [Thelazia callipaeda]|uniref:FBD domain-containing protein n=1 Tax=Thelazia callipaeda TaxID=103827 RepID=A0A0N5DAJ9_THECL|nr:unnamed protein product [Thelazia callipaeda]